MKQPPVQPDAANWWHYTANQWWGCTKVSEACAHCYAERFDKFVGRSMDSSGNTHWGRGADRLFIDGYEDKIRGIDRWYASRPAEPRPRVFTNSMSDWLDPEVPVRWLWNLIATIKDCRAVDHLLLTKRPELFESRLKLVWDEVPEARRSVDWWLAGGSPDNVWLGATVELQQHEERVTALLRMPAAVRFLSVEPALGEVNLLSVGAEESGQYNALQPQGVSWVIAGGESGGGARPSDPSVFRSLRDQCAATGTAFWFKQWGEWVGGKFDPRKSKLVLQDGRVEWIRSKARLSEIHFWGFREGPFEIVSARVGMRPKETPTISDGPPRLTENHRLDGCFIRELPTPRRKTTSD